MSKGGRAAGLRKRASGPGVLRIANAASTSWSAKQTAGDDGRPCPLQHTSGYIPSTGADGGFQLDALNKYVRCLQSSERSRSFEGAARGPHIPTRRPTRSYAVLLSADRVVSAGDRLPVVRRKCGSASLSSYCQEREDRLRSLPWFHSSAGGAVAGELSTVREQGGAW